ncbi:MAG: DNA-binding response OmpR family regulator, partial [Mariniblastus sp.]
MSNGSILLLDDDRELVDSFARWFERKGYEATRSYHPKQSLITAAEHNYDVAVIDTGVADMNGLVLLGELVELKMFPVIVLSGEANP